MIFLAIFAYSFIFMTKDQIIELLRSNKKHLEEKMGLKSIALFGSWARGNADENSDIDLIIELKSPKYFILMSIIFFLEKITGKKVDVVRRGPHLRKEFLETIEKEMIYV